MPHSRPTTPHQTDQVRGLDIELGEDGDIPGFALDLTPDDIDDIALDGALDVEERLSRLDAIAGELEQRRSGDYMGDMQALLNHVRDRMASLRSPSEGEASLGAVGMDAEDVTEDNDPADLLEGAEEAEASSS